jgi:RHS repeat-associated protein
MQMQLSSGTQIPDGLLAAMTLLDEKPRLGVPTWNPAPQPGINEHNSTVAIGMRAGLALNAARQSGRARYYGSNMGRFLSPDTGADAVMGVPVPYADLANPQSLNLYAYVGNNPLSRTDPDGHDYTICTNGQPCVHLTDQQYYDAIHGQGNNGISAPAFGQSGTITCGGAACGTATYMDQGAVSDLSGGQLMGIAGGKALEGVMGVVGDVVGQILGRGAGEAAGDVAGGSAKVLLQGGTKQAAKAVVDGLADSAQKATLKRSIARATTSESVSIKELADGSIEVVKTRPGFDGSQSMTTTIGKDGTSTTVQTAVDSSGAQVHYDPKN